MKTIVRPVSISLLLLYYGCILQDEQYPEPKDPSTVREITTGEYPSVSPDGRMLVFSRNGAIFICDTGGQYQKQLTSSGFSDIMPQWSPDGSMIGFVRKTYNTNVYGRLISIDTLTSIVRSIQDKDDVLCRFDLSASSYPYVSAPAWSWSLNGNFIAFYSGYDTLTTLSIVKTDGSGSIVGKYLLHRNRPNEWNSNRSGFCWLPTGDRLLCTSNAEQDSSSFFMITVGIGAMTPLNNKRNTSNPACSKDGRYFGYYSTNESSYQLYDIISGTTKPVSFGSYSPKLSPDGRKIISFSYYSNSNPDGYSSSGLRSKDVQNGTWSDIALSPWNYNFVIHPSSKLVFFSRAGIIRKAEIPQ